jgi:hypothetical protein
MHLPLAATGTSELLEILSPFIPDEFINRSFLRRRPPGRPLSFSPAQLWRLHLLSLLTPVHSFNLLVKILPEQKSWRRFARLPHRHRTPDVRMLNEFRTRFGVMGFRAINERLLEGILSDRKSLLKSVALIDATDLPAAAADQKKREKARLVSSSSQSRSPLSEARLHAFFCGLQKTFTSTVVAGIF